MKACGGEERPPYAHTPTYNAALDATLGFTYHEDELNGLDEASLVLYRSTDGGTTTEARTYAYRAAGLAPGRHAFRLRQVDHGGTFAYSPEVEVTLEMTAAFVLEPAYPNPFNPQTTLRFGVRDARPVRVDLYDAMGRRLRTLYSGTPAAGHLHAVWVDGSGLSSGAYFVRLSGSSIRATQQILLVK